MALEAPRIVKELRIKFKRPATKSLHDLFRHALTPGKRRAGAAVTAAAAAACGSTSDVSLLSTVTAQTHASAGPAASAADAAAALGRIYDACQDVANTPDDSVASSCCTDRVEQLLASCYLARRSKVCPSTPVFADSHSRCG